jgi:hypothetical protein
MGRERKGKEGKERNEALRNLFNHSRKYLKQADHHKPIPFALLAGIADQVLC